MRFGNSLKLLTIFAAWTLVALVFAGQSYFYGIVTGEDKEWSRVFWWTFADWYLWAALSPIIFWFARRYPFESREWTKSLVVHAVAAVGFSLVHLALQSIVQIATGWSKLAGGAAFATAFLFLFFKKIHLNLLTYAALVGINHAARIYRHNQQRKAEAHRLAAEKHRLEAELAGAELHALQMQLNPHFLFNSLNALSEMIHSDAQAADKMVVRLGDLLRLSLEREKTAETTLEQEIEFLRKYLEIEQIRFHDRLIVRFDIAPNVLRALVPSLVLQPLVENAVKHGIGAIPGAGTIEIVARRSGEKLKLVVRDNGAGLPADWETFDSPTRERIGLANTRARLIQLYDGASRFEIKSATANGGTTVEIEIPFREMCGEKSAARNLDEKCG